jgi:hypothetical protein
MCPGKISSSAILTTSSVEIFGVIAHKSFENKICCASIDELMSIYPCSCRKINGYSL